METITHISVIRKTGFSKNPAPVAVKPILRSGIIIMIAMVSVKTPLINTDVVHIKYGNLAQRLAPSLFRA